MTTQNLYVGIDSLRYILCVFALIFADNMGESFSAWSTPIYCRGHPSCRTVNRSQSYSGKFNSNGIHSCAACNKIIKTTVKEKPVATGVHAKKQVEQYKELLSLLQQKKLPQEVRSELMTKLQAIQQTLSSILSASKQKEEQDSPTPPSPKRVKVDVDKSKELPENSSLEEMKKTLDDLRTKVFFFLLWF